MGGMFGGGDPIDVARCFRAWKDAKPGKLAPVAEGGARSGTPGR